MKRQLNNFFIKLLWIRFESCLVHCLENMCVFLIVCYNERNKAGREAYKLLQWTRLVCTSTNTNTNINTRASTHRYLNTPACKTHVKESITKRICYNIIEICDSESLEM